MISYSARRIIKRIFPPVYGIHLALVLCRQMLHNYALWFLTEDNRRKARRLRQMHNLHRGQRCFLIGNGPSLDRMDLQLLREEYTVGCNRIYILFPELDFTTNYYVATDPGLLRHYGSEIARLSMPKFLSARGRGCLPEDAQTFWITEHPRLRFPADPLSGLYVGRTVLTVALQLTYYMGFQQVILIGADHRFELSARQDAASMLEDHNRNHFGKQYMTADFPFEYVAPDVMAWRMRWWEATYLLIREAYQADGREILDATVDGDLTIFPKISYASLF